MVDQNRRNTLKAIGGAAVVAAVPSAALAEGSAPIGVPIKEDAIITTNNNTAIPASRFGTEVTISLNLDGDAAVRLTNHTDKLVIVRQIYPGVVQGGNRYFDINSAFQRSAYAIGAGKSRLVPVQEVTGEFALHNSRQPQNNKQLRHAAVTGLGLNGKPANSTVGYFS